MKTHHPTPKLERNGSMQNPNITPISLKIPEAAKALGVAPLTIRRFIDRGLLRPSRILRTPLIPVEQLHALLNEGITR
jgi:Helix-turn-helix domain